MTGMLVITFIFLPADPETGPQGVWFEIVIVCVGPARQFRVSIGSVMEEL